MTPQGESTPLLEDDGLTQDRATVPVRIEEDVPFPWTQLIVLAFCRVAEPVAFVSIVAYSFEMVKAIKGENNASFYSGLLVSAFALAEACTAMFWGHLSDRYGRKPIILVALGGTALSSLLFGFATNYWLALLARVVGGLLNGNVAVMQTMVAEMVTRPEHEPKAYAMQPFVWSLGSIAGSALGGFTAEPARYHPKYFSKDGIFGKFPYLLPNLIAVVVIVVAMVQGFFLLQETNPLFVTQSQHGAKDLQEEVVDDEITPLSRQHSISARIIPKIRSNSDASYIAASAAIPNEPSFDLRRPSFTSISALKTVPKQIPTSTVESIEDTTFDNASANPRSIKAFNKQVILWILALTIMCYHQMAFAAILPIYLLDEPQRPPKHLDLLGGLGSTLPDVGTYLAVNSGISMIIQGFVFPILVGRLGVWRSVILMTLFCPLVYLTVPLVSLLPNAGIGIYIAMALQNFSTIIIYPSLLILLKNATASPLVLGKVNGLAMSACSGARTIAPPLVGIIYSTLGSAGAWWSCAIVAIIAAVEFCFISRPKDKSENILRKASMVAGNI